MPSPVKMTAASGGQLISREDAVLFSLFYQKQTHDPNQVILGHWVGSCSTVSLLQRPPLGPSPGLRGSWQTPKMTSMGQEVP